MADIEFSNDGGETWVDVDSLPKYKSFSGEAAGYILCGPDDEMFLEAIPKELADWIPLTFSDNITRLIFADKYDEVCDKWSKRLGLDRIPVPDDWKEDWRWRKYFQETEKDFLTNYTDYYRLYTEEDEEKFKMFLDT